MEVFLTTPAVVPSNARRSEPEIEPSHVGDGFVKLYLTTDIDGDRGSPGARQLISDQGGVIFFPRFDDVGSNNNMHALANLAGFWVNLIFGGGIGAQAEGWAWIRRIRVYNHD